MLKSKFLSELFHIKFTCFILVNPKINKYSPGDDSVVFESIHKIGIRAEGNLRSVKLSSKYLSLLKSL